MRNGRALAKSPDIPSTASDTPQVLSLTQDAPFLGLLRSMNPGVRVGTFQNEFKPSQDPRNSTHKFIYTKVVDSYRVPTSVLLKLGTKYEYSRNRSRI